MFTIKLTEQAVTLTFIISMEVFSVTIIFIVLNNFNLQKKSLSPSLKQHMENILSHIIKKHKINLFITSVMGVEGISMLLQIKAEILILTNGEMRLASNLEAVSEAMTSFFKYFLVYLEKSWRSRHFLKKPT